MSSKILGLIREAMKAKQYTWYVLPRTDEHQSEYLCPCDERVAFASGFTGSNALSVVSQEQALLWTDGRYFLQAEKQLHEGWKMMKMQAGEKKWFQVIADLFVEGATIGVDSRLITAQSADARFKLLEKKGFKVLAEPDNLIDQIWEDRPPVSVGQIYSHEEWAGKSTCEKVGWVRDQIKSKDGNAALFSDLSEIAWVLNLRSSEIPYHPFFKGILVVRKQGGVLYLPKNHPSLKSQAVEAHLKKTDIRLEEYEPKFEPKTLIQKQTLNHYLHSNLVDPIEWDGIGLYRAVRSDSEIEGFTNCHIRDGIAMAKFWSWRAKQNSYNEWEAAEFINQRRMELEHNKGLSFETICSGGPNAAIIHYAPTAKVNSDCNNDQIHLVDSGGQYLDGTTDVTRTFHFGTPTAEEKDSFTRVLLGNLDVERLQWPASSNITGGDVDVLARRYLWEASKDYMHGTGHGVGHFLGVHEGPVGIYKSNPTVFKPNMIVTNEPGYYEEGKYGIRIENVLVVKEQNGFCKFHNLTLCPYDANLLKLELLTEADKHYINQYHQRVLQTLEPLLKDDGEAVAWLKKATAPI